jgi:hypothetical protein
MEGVLDSLDLRIRGYEQSRATEPDACSLAQALKLEKYKIPRQSDNS